jgi:uncharacterized membrane protein HdeD (DUF308 family)
MAVLQPSQDYGSIAHKVWPWAMTRGALAVVFGVLALAWMLPAGTDAMFVSLIGIFAILDGVANGIEAFRRHGPVMVLRLIAGAAGVAFGITALIMPDMAMTQLTWMIAGWAAVIGVAEIIVNLMDRGSTHRDWMFGIIMGGLAVAFAVVIAIMMPVMTTMIWIAAGATILWGIAAMIMGGTERRFSNTTEATQHS